MEVGRGLGVEVHGRACSSEAPYSEEEMDLRRGPWTVEEDLILMNYISNHGEGRWNSLARCAGLKRTGKSCRLRWLNYLRPDVRRGNITPEEQFLILELHLRWGNRWSKIAQQLPGRTDNEIKNYWRTRVQKHAKQLRCDVNSKQFKDVVRYIWMPRLLERIRASSSSSPTAIYQDTVVTSATAAAMPADHGNELPHLKQSPESSSMAGSSSDSLVTQLSSPPAPEMYRVHGAEDKTGAGTQAGQLWPESFLSPGAYGNHGWPEFDYGELGGGDAYENFWSLEDDWFSQQ